MATARETIAEPDEPPIVFVSYSKHDKVWKDRLLDHLGVLEKAGLVSAWSDDDIDKGGEWLPPLVKAMKDASVAVCLMSHNYLNTDFCVKHEIPYLIERAEGEGLHLLFFMVSPADYAAHRWLADRQWFLRKGQCVETDFAGRENLPFSWLVKDIRERLGERVQTQEKPSVSDYIRQAVAALEADAANKPEPEPMPAVETIGPAFPALLEKFVDIERLPVTGKELFGRQDELQMLDDAWASDSTNIVTLTAWGGVGKSTLVNKWTERLARGNYRGAERVFAWSFYSQGMRDQTTSADAFIDAALRFFGDEDPSKGSPWAKGERLAEKVSKTRTLLLLDGMEPLQDPYQGIKDPALARLVECLAVENTGLCVISTRERVKELEDFPDQVIEKDLEQISMEAGRALLRVKRVRGSDAALEQASRDFGNQALAINLLASYLIRFANGDIGGTVAICDLPDVDEKDGKHPRRLMAAFAKQFGEGPELDLLGVMGLFDRPANAGCIAALRRPPIIPGLTDHLALWESGKLSTWWWRTTGRDTQRSSDDSWEELLAYLREVGLLAKASHHAPAELDTHPLVREHFGPSLRFQREDAWKAGHERLYEHLVTVPKKQQPDTLVEMTPLFQAIQHGCQAGRRQEVLGKIYIDRIVRRDEVYLIRQLGAIGTDLELLRSFFKLPFEQPATDLTASCHTWLLHEAGIRLRGLGRLQDALKPMQVSMDEDVGQKNWTGAAASIFVLSELELALGNVSAAIDRAGLGVEYADQSTDVFMRMCLRGIVADALHQHRSFLPARWLFEEAEAIQAKFEPTYPLLYSQGGYLYCDLLLTLGEAEEAHERAVYALNITLKGVGNLLDIARGYLFLGRAAMALDDWTVARTQLERAVDGLRKSGNIDELPRGLLARAAFFHEVEQYALSRRDLDEVIRLAKRCGMRLHECDAHLEYTRLEIKQGQPDVARVHVKAADALATACGYHRRDGEVAELKEELGL